MKALALQSYGVKPKPTEVPVPVPAAHQVRVRVQATSVNPVDWKQASGAALPVLRCSFPNFVPGYDAAGVIDAVGPDVTGFTVGERVHARIKGTSGGANAEFALITTDVLRPMPERMSFAEAAALPLAGLTALQGLRDVAGLVMRGSTQRVLINGASSGVGLFAVQIAKAAGATVAGICSTRNLELVRQHGADEVLDYTTRAAFSGPPRFELVLDTVGQNVGKVLGLLLPAGRYATPVYNGAILGRVLTNFLRRKKVRIANLQSNAADLAVLDELFARGALKVAIDSTFKADDLAQAWERSRSGRAAGKIVVDWA